MEVNKEIIVNKPIREVWEVLGKQYTEAYKWARGLYHSEGLGAPTLEGASCSHRACETSFGKLKEEIKVFDSENFVLAYEVVEGFPGFIKTGVNTWELIRINDTRTQVNIRFHAQTQGLMGVLMGPMMKMQLNKGLGAAIGDLKHYVETGKPSPGKAKDSNKQLKVAA